MMGGGDEFLMLQKGRQERHLQFISKERLSDSEESYRFTKTEKGKLLEYLALVLYPTPLTELISPGFRILLLFQR